MKQHVRLHVAAGGGGGRFARLPSARPGVFFLDADFQWISKN
jgi:hypothetical protein